MRIDLGILAFDDGIKSGDKKYSPEVRWLVAGVNEYGDRCRLGIAVGSSN